jgi:hypothetical protein
MRFPEADIDWMEIVDSDGEKRYVPLFTWRSDWRENDPSPIEIKIVSIDVRELPEISRC